MTPDSADAISPLGVLPPPGPSCVHLPLDVTPQELARYAVGLANARGGTVLVGADAPKAQGTGERDAGELHPLMVTHAIFELSGGRLTVNVQHWRQPGGGKVLAVFVPQAPYVLAAPDGAVLAWDGSHLVPVTPAESEPIAQQDYTAVVPPDASLADLDPHEVARLRGLGQKGGLGHLPDLDFLRELGLLLPSGGALRPTLAGILLAGTPAALKAHVPQAEVCFYHHQTPDVEFQFREDLLRPIPALLTRLAELIQARNRFTPVQVGLFRIEVWDQDEAVYREALLNALTHRDYTLRDAVHVHHYPDRLEIMNPGGLPGGITPGNILRHQPKRRNPLLAEVLARLGLVERAGVGVDKMYGLMLRHGKEPPEYTTYPDAVTLALHSPGFDAEFVRFVARKQEEMQTLSLDMLIVLSLLAREGEATRTHLARALQLPEDRTPRLLRGMEDHGLIARSGVGRGIAYTLSDEVRRALGRERPGPQVTPPPPTQGTPEVPARAPRPPRPAPDASGPTPAEVRAVALALAREQGRVRNRELREACGLNTQQAWRVLRRLVLEGHLVKRGTGTRDAAYELH
ncbi:ATP-dependent DNA helicase RecG [Deinococcus metallilatus]|uniref:ATP-dependent DNA helicase RecG n=1 Tax=Deinococcus metallilatus TaxID=1211322 RepID=A0AAJ5K347_9DEIO|nr:helix-turn-helix domain-containing protein [Deinococcus metallilatus]MBB5297441.1 ATP-dependent DNA helicase RecG [Deinococcus metallilatus]QBY08337.1 ATP-dependent DNA helicase RecG [Deinococcus metallilatus]RXJ11440.1 ATP-dependent DNA helicase RecG [Deinococcus metallilatus]TLK20613.1 ATP-dependent DNA helicase RecG [Deinococcus metallilatus]GMA16998.1 ATP-dependent DNA helicase RecG [Deinococcus metallilatus]